MNTNQLKFDKTITAWDDGVPLGNGDLGCLIWNNSNNLRFSIDKAGIWDCSDSPESQNGFNYNNLMDLVSRRKQRKINKIFDDCYAKTTPTKLPTGKLILDLGVDSNVQSVLDFNSAEATLNAGNVLVKSFIHANDNYGLIFINKQNVGMKILNPQFGVKNKFSFTNLKPAISRSLKNLKYDLPTFKSYNQEGIDYKYFVQPTKESFYGIVVGKKEIDGNTLIAYTVGIDKQGDFVNNCLKTIESALGKGYEKAYASHSQWWQNYSKLSTITLPDKYLEQQCNLNNYLLAACSRKGHFPMPLQGVWTADNDSLPPWKGDYHHDLNTQMSYTSYLKSNRVDEGECFIDFLIDLSEPARKFAKNFYNCKGLCLPSIMDIEGKALGGWSQYSLAPTNQLWLCYIMARHYFHTQNYSYLTEKIYPYMEEVGTFIMEILQEKNGVYKLPLSSSPEINNNSLSAWLTPNSNYDLALLHNFFEQMSKLSSVVGDENKAKIWADRLSKLEPLAVNSNDILMVSSNLSLKDSHRHHSHCMSIYPLRTLKYDNARNKKIIDSTIENLENLGIKFWVGYSFGWLANLYTIQGNGDKAYRTLSDFFKHYCTDNGFHVNGDHRGVTACGMKYRHFTLEGNFLALDGVNNMMLYSEENGLKVFPAIASDWKNVEFENLRGHGGILVSAKMQEGKLTYLKITATSDTIIKILNEDILLKNYGKSIALKKGDTIEIF